MNYTTDSFFKVTIHRPARVSVVQDLSFHTHCYELVKKKTTDISNSHDEKVNHFPHNHTGQRYLSTCYFTCQKSHC